MKRIIKWSLLVIWMVVIFQFSSMPAVVSDQKSRLVIYFFNALGLNLDSAFGELSNFIVRKAAHFTEYFVLSLLVYNAVIDEFKLKHAMLISVLGVFLYACTDEFHQTFVPGREGRFRDVLIDTAGGSAAVAMTYLINNIRRRNKSR